MKGFIKKTGAVLLSALMLGGTAAALPAVIPESSITVNAEKYGDFEYSQYSFEDDTIILNKYIGKNTTVTVPAKINGKKVVGLDYEAFQDNIIIQNIVIQEGIEFIYSSFSGCKNLKSISIPASVNNIEDAFGGCEKLTTIKVDPNSKYYTCVDGVLYNKNKTCIETVTTGIKTLHVPKSVKNIVYDGQLNYCHKLERITVDPDNTEYTSVDGVLFYKNKRYIWHIPYCLTSMTFPKETTLGKYPFGSAYNLKSIFVEPENKEYYSFDGIMYDKRATKVFFCPQAKTTAEIKGTVKTIKSSVFYNCRNLSYIKIPASVETIDESAFPGCKNLKYVYIPATVKTLGAKSFGYDSNTDKKYNDFTIYGVKGSAAEKYAKDNGFKFVAGTAPKPLTLNKQEMTMGNGETTKLSATVNVLSNKNVKWRTSDSKKLTVDQKGNVKAVRTGTAWITARASNGYEQAYRITVKNVPSKITLTKGVLTIGVGEKYSLGSNVNSGAGCATRTYRTSNSSVVKMTKTNWTGEFVGVKPGVAYVTVRTYNGKEHSCKITVKAAPKSVTISKKNLTLKVGQTATLSCWTNDNSGCAKRTFRTSNSSIVKMTNTNWTGSFKAIKAGTAWVTVRTYNGKESSCKVTVTK